MKEKEKLQRGKIKSYLVVWLLIFFAGILLLKEYTLIKYEEKAIFNPTEISSLGYEQDGAFFTQIEEGSRLDVSFNEVTFDNIIFNFTKPLENKGYLELYYVNNSQQEIFLKSVELKKGEIKKDIKIEEIKPEKLSAHLVIEGNQGFELKNILIYDRVFDILQNSLQWIISMLFIFLVSGALAFAVIKFQSYQIENKSKKRESNIEVLRIVSMILIIAHHLIAHGGAMTTSYSKNQLISAAFIPVGKICFIGFLAISTWFLVDSKFQFRRFIKVWLQVCTYSFVFSVIAFFMGRDMSIKDFLGSLLPIAGNAHGFASSYLLLLLLVPFLNKIMGCLGKTQARVLVIIVFYIQVGSQIIGKFINYTQPLQSEITLFILCYLISYNLKKWPVKIFEDLRFSIPVLLGIYILGLQSTYQTLGNSWLPNSEIVGFIRDSMLNTESGLLFIIAGYALFFTFKNIQIKYNKYINYIAGCTFGVLLIHDHTFFREIFWKDIIMTDTWYHAEHYLLYLLIVVMLIFYVCIVIESLRKTLIESYIMKLNTVQMISEKVDRLFD